MINDIASNWKNVVVSKDSLAVKCLKMAQVVQYPKLDINEYNKKIIEIGDSLNEVMGKNKSPTYQISMLNEVLFDDYGYDADMEDYYNPENNFLNKVIDKKTGIPVTLSILYIEVARMVGLDLKIVGFPSHALVKYNEEMILDPFDGGRLLDVDDLQDILDRNYEGSVKFDPDFLNDIETDMILIRMTRNLKNSFAQSYAYEKALLCTDMILSLVPSSVEDIRDKGVLEERVSNHDTALEYLNKYIEINPNGNDVDHILEIMKMIKENANR